MWLQANQWLSGKVATTFLVQGRESGWGGERRREGLGQAHAFGQNDTEAVEQGGLGRVGARDAAQADIAVCGGGQHHVVRLNAGEFFEERARGVSDAGALLPHLQSLPHHEGEETDKDMGLNAIFALMPDGTDVELIFLNAEGGFGLGELDVSFPEFFAAPVVDIGTQEIGALRDCSPVVERSIVGDAETEAGLRLIRIEGDVETGGGALIALEDASDLPVDLRPIETCF